MVRMRTWAVLVGLVISAGVLWAGTTSTSRQSKNSQGNWFQRMGQVIMAPFTPDPKPPKKTRRFTKPDKEAILGR